ncbi:MAG: hypothetical protein F6K58_13690 [Symploca sp. SIO2E9]|nr:hypothetical protein [Symploca sp. SIO2E9]
MLRKFVILLMSVTLCLTTLACGSPETTSSASRNSSNASAPTRLSDGKYPVQQATYDDGDGQYSLMLLNTPAGTPPVFSTANLQMARLTEEEVAAGEKTYLKVDDNQPVMYLTEDFKIEYVHNVAETQTNPQTGQQETVIVRQQSSFWAPFAGALAGQALGSLLFRPQYYVPPVYQPGGILTGYGGYGSTYNQAVDRYQTRYQAPPPAVSNRQALRTSGRLRNSGSSTQRSTAGRNSANTNKSTGSGFGSSNLRQSGKSGSSRARPSNSGFGSSGTRRRSFSGGRRRR